MWIFETEDKSGGSMRVDLDFRWDLFGSFLATENARNLAH